MLRRFLEHFGFDAGVVLRVDDRFYEEALAELTERRAQPGLIARAIALSKGDENAARSYYVRVRAKELASRQRANEAARVAGHHAAAASAEAERAKAAEEAYRGFEARYPKVKKISHETAASLYASYRQGRDVAREVDEEAMLVDRRAAVIIWSFCGLIAAIVILSFSNL